MMLGHQALPAVQAARRSRTVRLSPWPVLIALLSVAVLAAGIATARDVMLPAPHPGFLASAGGRIVELDPDGAAARAGLRLGDQVTAIDGQAVTAMSLASLRPLAVGDVVAIDEGKPGSFTLFTIRVDRPSATEQAGNVVALVAALVLWLSGLFVGVARRCRVAARMYGVAALFLALALVAAVAAEAGLAWGWPALAPATIAGLIALALAQAGLAGRLSRRFVGAGVVACCVLGVAALSADFGVLAGAADLVTGLAAVLLCMIVIVVPLAGQRLVRAPSARRRLRVALPAALAGLLPVCAWPGALAIAAAFGYRPALPAGAHASALLGVAGLAPMAMLYAALFTLPSLRDLERELAWAASVAAAALLAICAWLALMPRVDGSARVAVAACIALAFVVAQRATRREIEARVRHAQADYVGAARAIEDSARHAASPETLAHAIGGALPAVLHVRGARVVLGSELRDRDTYHGASGEGRTLAGEDGDEELEQLIALERPAWRPPGRAARNAGESRPGPVLWAPLYWDTARYGALALECWNDDDAAQDLDLDEIARLASLIAMSLHTATLAANLQERTNALITLTHRLSQAHEQERAGLARELHDVVAQELIALTRHLRRYGHDKVPPAAIWADMLAGAQDALVATRRICNGLRPAILDLGLAPALRDLVADAADGDAAPEIGLVVEGQERRYDGDLEFALYRVAQEGINNALAHAYARQIRVELGFNQGLHLVVRDDGRGFEVPSRFEDLPGDHLGLIGMRERVSQFGGILTVSSAPGRGTVLSVRVSPRNT